ncbi:MAG: anti-sigma factor [Acidobacteriota bacterium]|nr:anti-sigma factor [Acidobacteriota bacterium]
MVNDVAMNCSELSASYGLDAIGLAGAEAHREIGAHLERGCAACGEAMRRARDAAGVLGIAASGGDPAPALRRALARGNGSRAFVWIPLLGALLAFAVVACLYFAGRENDTGRELGRVNEIRRAQNIAITRFNDAAGILGAPGTRAAALEAAQGSAPAGRVFASDAQGVVLIAANLPPVAAGKAYQMWWMSHGGSASSAGVFQPAPDGSAFFVQRGAIPSAADAVAVTLEDAGGAAVPSARPVFRASIRE